MIITPAASRYCFTGMACISLGVHWKVQIDRYRGTGGCAGIPVSAGIQGRVRISWRKGTRAGSGSSWPGAAFLAPWTAAYQQSSQKKGRAGVAANYAPPAPVIVTQLLR